MKSKSKWILILLVFLLVFRACLCHSPNIVLILTDDQDLLLKSLEYLPKIDKLITNKGAIFTNSVSVYFKSKSQQLIT